MRTLVASLVVTTAVLLGVDPSLATPAGTTTLEPVPYDPLPASFDELPEGPRTTLPWWQDDKLHVGRTKIRTTVSTIASRGGTTVIGREGWRRHSISEWYLVVGDRLERLPTRGHTDLPLVSADGRWIAWLDERATPVAELKDDVRYRLVVFDVEEGEVADTFRNRRRVLWEDGINGIWLRSVDNRGRAFFTLGRKGKHLWKPDRRPVPLIGDLNDDQDMDGWPLGIMQYRNGRHGSHGVGVYGTVNRSGEFAEVGEIRSPFPGSWSATGDAYFYQYYTDPETFWVDRVTEDRSVQLGVPTYDGHGLQTVGWESETSVIIWLHDTYGDERVSLLVRCDAVTGDCERVRGGPRLGSRATMQDR